MLTSIFYERKEKSMEQKKEKRAPINTAKEVHNKPDGFIIDAMVLGGNKAILRQESQGQRSFVGSDTLPTKFCRDGSFEKTVLEAAGVKFLGIVDSDPMFQYVELPNGWRKEATDHSMWSKLLDDKGRERAAIFYKAAFYDRSAHILLACRYNISVDYDRLNKENICVANITDCGDVIYSTEPECDQEGLGTINKARNAAAKWLDENYSDWRNPGAYWD